MYNGSDKHSGFISRTLGNGSEDDLDSSNNI